MWRAVIIIMITYESHNIFQNQYRKRPVCRSQISLSDSPTPLPKICTRPKSNATPIRHKRASQALYREHGSNPTVSRSDCLKFLSHKFAKRHVKSKRAINYIYVLPTRTVGKLGWSLTKFLFVLFFHIYSSIKITSKLITFKLRNSRIT